MTDENIKENNNPVSDPKKARVYNPTSFKGNSARGRGGRRDGGDHRKPTFEKPKPEFDQKIVSIRRVTRVVAGGRRMTFAVALAIGDKKGSIGLGTGKGGDTAVAINKALKQAKKNMFKINTSKDMSIEHEVSAKFSSSKLYMFPNRGKGLVAGSTVRDLLSLAGLKNVTAKLNSGSKNKLNNARVAYLALSKLGSKIKPAEIEDLSIENIENIKILTKEEELL